MGDKQHGHAQPLLQMRWIVKSHFRDQWPDWEAALSQVLADNPDFDRVPAGRARVEGQIAVAMAAQGRRRDALRQITRTLRSSWREPRAAVALAVVAGPLLGLCQRAAADLLHPVAYTKAVLG